MMKEKIKMHKRALKVFLEGEWILYGKPVNHAVELMSLGLEEKIPLTADMTLFLGSLSYACKYIGEEADSFALIPRNEPLSPKEIFKVFRMKMTEDVLQGVFFFYTEMAEKLIEFTDIDEFDATLKCFILSIYLYRESRYLKGMLPANTKDLQPVVMSAVKELAFITFGGYKTTQGDRAIWMDDISVSALIRYSNHPEQTLRERVLKKIS